MKNNILIQLQQDRQAKGSDQLQLLIAELLLANSLKVNTTYEEQDSISPPYFKNSSKVFHMWLVGCPNPYKMEQSWECTFLRLFTHTNPKSASKIIFIIGLKNYYLSSTANTALMGCIGSACLLVSLKSNDRICF